MKTVHLLFAVVTFSVICVNANAQLNRLNQAVQRGVQRGVETAVEKKAEEKAEEAVTNAFDKADAERAKNEEETEKALQQVVDMMEQMQQNQAEADAQMATIPEAIPTVGSAPYTPSESEYAFFPMKTGSVQVFVSKDNKGKVTSQARNTIKAITGGKDAFAIEYESEILDDMGIPTDKDKPLVLNFRVVIKDGLMYLDMKGLFGAIDGINDMQASGTGLKIPSNLAVGQTLEDANTRIRIGFINCLTSMTEGKCLAIEDVKVDAGTFRCHKVSYKTNATVMGIRSEGTVITWYAKGVGTVKSESYDKNGNLLATTELKSNS